MARECSAASQSCAEGSCTLTCGLGVGPAAAATGGGSGWGSPAKHGSAHASNPGSQKRARAQVKEEAVQQQMPAHLRRLQRQASAWAPRRCGAPGWRPPQPPCSPRAPRPPHSRQGAEQQGSSREEVGCCKGSAGGSAGCEAAAQELCSPRRPQAACVQRILGRALSIHGPPRPWKGSERWVWKTWCRLRRAWWQLCVESGSGL